MQKPDNTTLYVILGIVGGPIAGAAFGYGYAQKKQLLYKLDPSAERGWDNRFVNTIVGILGGSIAGALFGYNSAKLEMQINELTTRKLAAQQHPNQGELHAQGHTLVPAKQQWQEYVASRDTPQAELAR